MIERIAPTEDDPAVQCPRDLIPMERLKAGAVNVDRCDKCGGIWLDSGELQALLSLKQSSTDLISDLDVGAATETHTRHSLDAIKCPRDGSALREIPDAKQPHILFDACIACGGVFFDAGELADLSEFTLKERLRSMLVRV